MTAAFLYILPCAYEDLLKLGHSRDPLRRMHELNARYYEFFDIDRAFVVMTETVREAKALELQYRRLLAVHSAPAPLVINERAGFTEWYRGAYALLADASERFQTMGYIVHRPLRSWIKQRLEANEALLFSCAQMLSDAELQARGEAARSTGMQRRVADVLDAYAAFGFDLTRYLPEPIVAWHRG